MATPENEILFPENIIKAPSQKDCKKIECIVNTIEALARCTNKGMYIIDYHKKNFLYVSQGMAQLFEKTQKEILNAGSSIYTELIPEEDQNIIREINKQGRIKLNETPISEKLNYSLSYDFQIICDGKKRMINNQMTPLLLNSKGEIWLTLGTIAQEMRCCPVPAAPHPPGAGGGLGPRGSGRRPVPSVGSIAMPKTTATPCPKY